MEVDLFIHNIKTMTKYLGSGNISTPPMYNISKIQADNKLSVILFKIYSCKCSVI